MQPDPASSEHAHRIIDVAGVATFRDVGGLRLDSRRTQSTLSRRGLVYRSNFSTLTAEGKRAMEALGIRHVFDLRDVAEAQPAWETLHNRPRSCAYQNVPMFDSMIFNLPLVDLAILISKGYL